MVTLAGTGLDLDDLVRDDGRDFRVHGRVYTDERLYELELEQIFHRGWLYVGHASEIPEPGDYRLKWMGRASVIMTRGEDGEVRLLMNRCRHRANAVCQAEAGNASYFRCAYHGWTYSNDGALVGVTYQNRYGPDFRKDELGLTPVPRMGVYRGLVFGSLSPEGIGLDEHLGLAKDYIDRFIDLSPEGELDLRGGVNKYDFQANWKFQLENSMDGYHDNFTHQSLRDIRQRSGRSGRPRDDVKLYLRALGGGHCVMYDADLPDSMPLTPESILGAFGTPVRPHEVLDQPWAREYLAAMERRHGPTRAAHLLTYGGVHMCVFPNLVFLQAQMRVIRPVGVARTEILSYPCRLKGAPQELNEIRLRGHEEFFGPAGFGSPDDVEMFDRNQIGLSAFVDPWLILTRGLHEERTDGDGTVIDPNTTDELSQRAIWRHWKAVMAQATARR